MLCAILISAKNDIVVNRHTKRKPRSRHLRGFHLASCHCRSRLTICRCSSWLRPPQRKPRMILSGPIDTPPFRCRIGCDNIGIISQNSTQVYCLSMEYHSLRPAILDSGCVMCYNDSNQEWSYLHATHKAKTPETQPPGFSFRLVVTCRFRLTICKCNNW